MTGSALSKLTELTQLRWTFQDEKKEMRLKTRGRVREGERVGIEVPLGVGGGASADL